jgi:hypothetical protein
VFQDRLASVPRRPALAGLAVLTILLGTVAIIRAAELVWAADINRNLEAARALLGGDFGTVADYLYSPLAAALTIPALAVPRGVAIIAWLAFKIAIVVAGTAVATRGLDRTERVLIGIAVIGFLPLVYDLELGNVTVLMLGAVALVAWTPDRLASGIPLGLILATTPKPQLIPVLIWMLVVHRKALIGALVSAALAIGVGVALIGLSAWATWVEILRAPAYLNAGEVINLSLWAFPAPVAIAAGAVSIVAYVIAMTRGYWPGLVAAICLGMLLSPYTLIYSAGLLLAAAPALARAAPRATLALALIAPIVLLVAFPIWVGAVLFVAVGIPAARWPPAGLEGALRTIARTHQST